MSIRLLRRVRFLQSMGPRYLGFKLKELFAQRVAIFESHLEDFRGAGIEVGGPSAAFKAGGLFPVYQFAERVDNVTFANKTRWEGDVEGGQTFHFHPTKAPGLQFVLEGGGLSTLPAASYDFVLSCHMLEHAANPLRALREWWRLLKTGGKLLLILPHRDGSFDHRRPITTLEHLVSDYQRGTDEGDTTHLYEILALHDLRRDPEQTSMADFKTWIVANEKNRGAHHHVFDVMAAVQMLTEAGFDVRDAQAAMPFHICLFASKPPEGKKVTNETFLRSDAEVYRSSPFRSDRLGEFVA